MVHPQYHLLDNARRRYYLYWRSSVARGSYPPTDEGYIWLHMHELFFIDDDFRENLAIMRAVREHYATEDPVLDAFLGDVILNYIVRVGEPVPDLPDLSKDMRGFRICQILSSPTYRPLSVSDLESMYRMSSKGWDSSKEHIADVVGRILWRMGDVKAVAGERHNVLHVLEGHGVASPEIRLFFKDDPSFVMRYGNVFYSRFRNMVGRIVKAVYHRMHRPESKACSQAMADLPLGALEVFEDEFARTGAFDPLPRVPELQPYCTSNKGYWSSSGIKLSPPKRDGHWPSYRFTMRMEAYSRLPLPPGPIIPSTSHHPSYSRMYVQEMQSFYEWRRVVESGSIPNLDSGYAWLMMSELLNDSTRDPSENLKPMLACCRIIEHDGWGRARDAMAGYCLVHGLVPEGFDFDISSEPVSALMRHLVINGRFPALGPGGLNRITKINLSSRVWDSVLAALNALYGDKDFRESLDEPGVSVFCTLFDGFPCSIPNWEVIVPMANGRAYRNLTNVCRIVKSLLDDNGGVSNPRGFPKEWRCIIEKALFEHDVKAHVASLPELVLDQNEVSRAEMDLETVSRIMSTSDSSETDSDGAPIAVVDTHVDVPLPLSLPEGGWESFMSRLDDVQRDYLHKALNGTPTKARIEKSINEMALEEVGDVILEDGNVLNDYSDEILKRIG
ncbi:MAG: TerB N-terminal domain-containing protein [Candidatus Methanomethylophilaceae archaeon]|nr:TerB N-terminal domain-containing protein [Candidatus Methanomethylophilaceae archaeon]